MIVAHYGGSQVDPLAANLTLRNSEHPRIRLIRPSKLQRPAFLEMRSPHFSHLVSGTAEALP